MSTPTTIRAAPARAVQWAKRPVPVKARLPGDATTVAAVDADPDPPAVTTFAAVVVGEVDDEADVLEVDPPVVVVDPPVVDVVVVGASVVDVVEVDEVDEVDVDEVDVDEVDVDEVDVDDVDDVDVDDVDVDDVDVDEVEVTPVDVEPELVVVGGGGPPLLYTVYSVPNPLSSTATQ
jgi:hypothetical protein